MIWVTTELKYRRHSLLVSKDQRVTTHSLTDSFLSNGAASFLRIGHSLGSPLLMETDDTFKMKFNITLPPATKQNLQPIQVLILAVPFFICGAWFLVFRGERKLQIFENKEITKLFGVKNDDVIWTEKR
jgi:hypothetical protein